MDSTVNRAGPIKGEFRVPADKSISHRSLLVASIADGTSVIHNLLDSHDTASTVGCLEALGVKVRRKGSVTEVTGKGPYGFHPPRAALDARNSGTTLRLLSGILAGLPMESVLTGDSSLRRRPMNRVIEPLQAMGARIESTPPENPPITIRGKKPLRPISYLLPIPSAQVKSAILLAGLYADGTTIVSESIPTRDHTERLLGLSTENEGNIRKTSVRGGMRIASGDFVIPGDISSALFLIIAAALVEGSDCCIHNVGLNPTRSYVIDILKRAGVRLEVSDLREHRQEPTGTIHVLSSHARSPLSLAPEEAPLLIDEIPALAIFAACSGVAFSIKGGAELRVKESDRIALLTRNLRSMGMKVDEYSDGFAFEPNLHVIPTRIETGGDHRIAMAFAVGGLVTGNGMTISDAESTEVSFPGFWQLLASFNA